MDSFWDDKYFLRNQRVHLEYGLWFTLSGGGVGPSDQKPYYNPGVDFQVWFAEFYRNDILESYKVRLIQTIKRICKDIIKDKCGKSRELTTFQNETKKGDWIDIYTDKLFRKGKQQVDKLYLVIDSSWWPGLPSLR